MISSVKCVSFIMGEIVKILFPAFCDCDATTTFESKESSDSEGHYCSFKVTANILIALIE